MASGGVGYQQQYGHGCSTAEEDLASVAFHQPVITSQPQSTTGGPRHDGYQSINSDADAQLDGSYDISCFNTMNKYLVQTCVPPKKKAKKYAFITVLNGILSICLCACCTIPCLCVAYELSKSIKTLNYQGDYLSAKTRSWMIIACNIIAFVFIFIIDIIILTIFILLMVAVSRR